jgi:glucosyl-3-phosphoglycerate synthase
VRPDVTRWLDRRTSRAADWPLERLRALKGKTAVSVVIPALDEAATIGAIIETIRGDLMGGPAPLVDEIVVMDSGSSDATVQVAERAGAFVVRREDVLDDVTPLPGKGEVLWRSLAATQGDLLVFVDGDLEAFSSSVVTGLLGPLLGDRSVALVKGIYDRPLRDGDRLLPSGGGRVTELVARPLINLHWPELSGVVQPLVGEYAARRTLLEQLPFPTGYGVELAILVDTLALAGLDAIAQVDLGVRLHQHQGDAALGRMAAEIWQTALRRLDPLGRTLRPHGLGATLAQFERQDGVFVAHVHDVSLTERPPILQLEAYTQGLGRAAS